MRESTKRAWLRLTNISISPKKPESKDTRKFTVVTLVTLLALASSAGSNASTRLSPGGVTSENLEWVKNVPVGGFTEGATLVGHHLYVTDDVRGLVIFDVSEPEAPRLVGEANVPHALENEDVATNGNIALLSQVWAAAFVDGESHSRLNVLSVSDPTNPHVISALEGAGDHTYECLLECSWAYGAPHGDIIDLRDPWSPRIAGNWKRQVQLHPDTLAHDTAEVARGRVLVAGPNKMYYLDASKPDAPKLIGESEEVKSDVPEQVLHTVDWPKNDGTRRFALSSTESTGPAVRCEANDLAVKAFFRTWETFNWTKKARVLTEWGPSNGLLVDGDPPVSVHGAPVSNNGCATHWFQVHPQYNDNGIVALAAYAHGLKLLQVGLDGEVAEKGYFLPHVDDVGAPVWITNKIVYSISFNRGIDILRYRPGRG